MPESADPSGEHRLGLLTRAQIRARVEAGAVVLLPVGSLEQHGDHLPVSTDALLVETVCLRAAEQAAPARDLLVTPALWPGFSPHHLRFGASVSLPGDLYLRLIAGVASAIREWSPRTLIVNGHGGNRGPLITLSLETGCPVVSYWELAGAEVARLFPVDASIGHAGEAETGMMLEAFPHLVGRPGPGFEPPSDSELLAPDLGPSGVIGDPGAASAEAGAEFLRTVAERLVGRVDAVFPPSRKES